MDKKFKYLSGLLEREIKNNSDIKEYEYKILKNALDKAWEIRNFEIGLYWKRALYFWGFIALAFSAPVVILKLKQDLISNPLFNKWFFATLSCIVGCFLSYGWYLANRGSKYWQENWEKWITYLEEYKYGNIYANPINESDINIDIFSSGKFSLSRINIIASLFITLVWAILGLYFSYNIKENEFCFPIIYLLALLWVLYFLYKNTKS